MTTERGPRPNPLVRGELVYLRAFEPEDAELVHRWYSHADTARLMGEWPRSLAGRGAGARPSCSRSTFGFTSSTAPGGSAPSWNGP